MQKRLNVKKILEILSRGNNAEVKQNKNGDIVVLEVTKKIVDVSHDN